MAGGSTFSAQANDRAGNRGLILRLLRDHEPVSRKGLAGLSGLSAPAVGAIVQKLIGAGLVAELGRESSARVGRRAINLGLLPTARCVLGVRLQKGFLRLALVDLRNRVLARESRSLDTADPERVVAAVADLFEPLAQAAGVPAERVVQVGVAAPGLVDSGSGVVKVSVNLGWREVALAEQLSLRLGRPVHVENSANAAAFAQKTCGPGRDCAHLAYLTLSVGISAGLIVDHRVYGGARGYAAELGHLTVALTGGPPCRCGKTGCLEAYCGLEAVVARAQAACRERAAAAPEGFAEVVERAAAGDPVILRVVEETGRILGAGVAALVNLCHPELVVLGGELMQLGQPLLAAVEAGAREHALAALLPEVRIVASTFTEDPSLVGATALALDALFAAGLAEPT